MEIYNRQKDIPMSTDIKVAIIGLGGVGYWVAKFLAMSGVKEFILFDDDTIEVHNLNRLDLPLETLGMNKADVAKQAINTIRDNVTVRSYPFPFKPDFLQTPVDFVIDCTDKVASQKTIFDFAKSKGLKYVKVGYDGTHITIANKVATWGESPGGYTITPSWVVPAVLVASLATGAILKYFNKELSIDVSNMYRSL